MKLVFKQKYISIEQFEPTEISNFSILTGKNGSGKTHFLQAIKNGHIVIEGIDKSEIIYYNYNDFTVFTGTTEQNSNFQSKLRLWKEDKELFLNKIRMLKVKADEYYSLNRNLLELAILKTSRQSKFNFTEWFGNKNDYQLLEECKLSSNLIDNILAKKDFFTIYFFNFISQFIDDSYEQTNKYIEDLTLERVKYIYNEQQNIFENYLENEEKDLLFFIKNSVKNKGVLNLDLDDFESPLFFLKDIESEEKEYQLSKQRNILNKIKATEYNHKTPFLEADEFRKKYGLSPIEQINLVLSEYDCNGYFLEGDSNQDFLGIAHQQIRIPISLVNKDKGYQTNFAQLSSGEKTLITLSLLIYKIRKEKIIPRVLLLDEIDSSLHPSMINRLLSVIQNLFIEKQGFRVIMATHSPTTVALSPDDSIFIIDKDSIQKIKKELRANAIDILTEGFATINEEETNTKINYNINQTELSILFTEGITDKIILETAWSKIYETIKMPFYIQDCFDASFLGNLFRRGYDGQDGIFINYPERKFIALFDFDQEGYNAWNSLNRNFNVNDSNPFKALTRNNSNNGYALLLPVPQNPDIQNQVIKNNTNETFENKSILPIELLFYGKEPLNHYFIKERTSGGGEIIVFKGKKRDFAEQLKSFNKEIFTNFTPLFDKIKEITQ